MQRPAVVNHGKDMFNVPPQVFIEFGLQLSEFLLSFAHVLLELQARFPCVVVAACESTTVTHLVSYAHRHKYILITTKVILIIQKK